MLWTIIIILVVLWALGFGFAGVEVRRSHSHPLSGCSDRFGRAANTRTKAVDSLQSSKSHVGR